VRIHHEVALLTGLVRSLRQRTFDLRGEDHVLEASAHRAHEVVVVFGELFGEFVPRHVVGRHHPVHGPALLEDREVAVERALRLSGPEVDELGDRHRSARLFQQLDQLPAATGVALARAAELLVDDVVEFSHTRKPRGDSRNERTTAGDGVTRGVSDLDQPARS
jgi:hypothetical protein